MQRRQLLKHLAALGSGTLLLNTPLHLLAKTQQNEPQLVNFKSLFNKALANNPNLIGFANTASDFSHQTLTIEGNVPKDIQGQFFRNGPAKHERAGDRYQHLFEGDGMLQCFTIGNGKITHTGKFINTPKFEKEQQAQRFVYSGPDTKLLNSSPVSSPDTINTANTNVIAVGNDLWALWEAGSATSINKNTLQYQGQVTLGEGGKYANTLKRLPFSAHPKVEPNGDI